MPMTFFSKSLQLNRTRPQNTISHLREKRIFRTSKNTIRSAARYKIVVLGLFRLVINPEKILLMHGKTFSTTFHEERINK
jgi:hypothetical protein